MVSFFVKPLLFIIFLLLSFGAAFSGLFMPQNGNRMIKAEEAEMSVKSECRYKNPVFIYGGYGLGHGASLSDKVRSEN